VKESLVGSTALKENGISLQDSVRIPYLHGVILNSDSTSGLLRRPLFYKNDKIALKVKAKREWEKFKDDYFGLNGFTAQIVIVVSNLVVLFIVPLPFIFLGYFVMTERSSVHADPFGVVYLCLIL